MSDLAQPVQQEIFPFDPEGVLANLTGRYKVDPAGFIHSVEHAGNVNASVGAGTTLSGAVCIASECLLDNADRAVCNKCGYVGFDCDNWIGGLGRLCSYCCSEHFAGLR